jgi:hypothetical protein
MHGPHGDVHETLYDDCEACAEIAEDPFAKADDDVIRRLIERAVAQPRVFDGTATELVAIRNVLNALERAGKLASTHPSAFERYLDRWGLRAALTRKGIV